VVRPRPARDGLLNREHPTDKRASGRRVPLDCVRYRRLIGVPTEPPLICVRQRTGCRLDVLAVVGERSRAPVLRQNLMPAPKRSINRQMFGENKIWRAGHDRRDGNRDRCLASCTR